MDSVFGLKVCRFAFPHFLSAVENSSRLIEAIYCSLHAMMQFCQMHCAVFFAAMKAAICFAFIFLLFSDAFFSNAAFSLFHMDLDFAIFTRLSVFVCLFSFFYVLSVPIFFCIHFVIVPGFLV